MFVIDAHLYLGMNAFEWNRDLRKSAKKNKFKRTRIKR